MRAVWGGEAINDDKKDEEGILQEKQLIWGIYMDFQNKVASLPELKCIKAQHLLALPELQYGSRQVPKKLVQELRGSAQFWITAQPALGVELPALDKLLGGTGTWAEPAGTEAEPSRAKAR